MQNSHDWTLLKYWGLLEPCDGKMMDGSSNGFYYITKDGIDFVNSRAFLNKYVILFNKKFLGFDGDIINIEDALGDKFNYRELMAL